MKAYISLELLTEFNPQLKDTLAGLITEGTEILKIVVASINTTKEKLNAASKPKNKE